MTAVVDADVEAHVQRFVAVWNETDPATRRAGTYRGWRLRRPPPAQRPVGRHRRPIRVGLGLG
jgi:hypothetical protein